MDSAFSTLPLDVMGVLQKLISMQDAKQLRLTSHAFAAVFAPQVLHTMTIEFTKDYHKQLVKLQLLASGKTRANEYTKSLQIRSLTTRKVFPDPRHPKIPEYLSEETDSCEDELEESFAKALSQLENLECISWFPHPFYEQRWAYTAMNQLLTGPNLAKLRHFTISIYYLTVYLPESPPFTPTPLHIPFHNMTGLRSIKITGIRSLDEVNFKRFCALIRAFLHLEEIYLEVLHAIPIDGDDTDDRNQDALMAILSQHPSHLPALPLKSITLRDTIPRLTQPILTHFRSLKTLHVEVRLMAEDTVSCVGQLWSTLETESIHLEYLTTSLVVPSLLSYIESYTTLKGIEFIGMFDGWPTPEENDRFFAALLGHKESLEEVSIAPLLSSGIREGRWTASSPANAAVFSQLKSLKKAKVGVKGLLPYAGDAQDNSQVVLTMVIGTFMKLPHMRVLHLDTQEESRMNGQGSISLNPRVGLRNAIRAFVRNIDIHCDAVSSEPFTIESGRETYTVHRVGGAGAESWVYRGSHLAQEYDDEPYHNYVYSDHFGMYEESA